MSSLNLPFKMMMPWAFLAVATQKEARHQSDDDSDDEKDSVSMARKRWIISESMKGSSRTISFLKTKAKKARKTLAIQV